MALPNKLDPTQPPDTQDESLGAARIREGRQFILDVLGLPANTNITNKLLGGDGVGLKHIYLQNAAVNPVVDGELLLNGSQLMLRLGGIVYHWIQHATCKIYRTADLNVVSSGTATLMPMQAMAWDSGGIWSSNFGGFTVPFTGYYDVEFNIDYGYPNLAFVNGSEARAYVFVNSGQAAYCIQPFPLRVLRVKTVLSLAAGDTVQLYVSQSSTKTVTAVGGVGATYGVMTQVG